MTIDDFEEYAKSHDCVIFTRQQYEHVIDVFNNYELLLFDYYGRLKVDMLAMLEDLQLEVEESENCGKAFHLGLQMASNIIQEKINELKAESEDEK